jgi:hypothetical protein
MTSKGSVVVNMISLTVEVALVYQQRCLLSKGMLFIDCFVTLLGGDGSIGGIFSFLDLSLALFYVFMFLGLCCRSSYLHS